MSSLLPSLCLRLTMATESLRCLPSVEYTGQQAHSTASTAQLGSLSYTCLIASIVITDPRAFSCCMTKLRTWISGSICRTRNPSTQRPRGSGSTPFGVPGLMAKISYIETSVTNDRTGRPYTFTPKTRNLGGCATLGVWGLGFVSLGFRVNAETAAGGPGTKPPTPNSDP